MPQYSLRLLTHPLRAIVNNVGAIVCSFYSMPRILRRVCSNVLQRRAPLISFVGNFSYRSNICVDCKAYANFRCQRGNRYDRG
jgi:hypothetical protein